MTPGRAIGATERPRISEVRTAVAAGLGAAAGRAGFRTRRRRFEVGYAERKDREAIGQAARVTFVMLVALPLSLVLLYYLWLAEDRFVSEARFLLRVNEAELVDGLGGLTGLPSIEMKRDTQVVASFLESAAIVAALERGVALTSRLAGAQPEIGRPETWVAGDWVARLDPDATAEERLAFWREIADVEIELPAGIVVLEVEAFTPTDAMEIALAALDETESLVNDLNRRAWTAAREKAEEIFRGAADRFADVQARLTVARNRAGLVDAGSEANMRTGLASRLRASLAELAQERAAKAPHLAPGSVQLGAIDRRMEALRRELARLRSAGTYLDNAGNLADQMAVFSELEVEQELAERQFLAAARTLEMVREAERSERIYIDLFVPPTAAEDPTRPRRGISVALWLVVLVLLWAVVAGSYRSVRRHVGWGCA